MFWRGIATTALRRMSLRFSGKPDRHPRDVHGAPLENA
jgi:hypothetical protein